MTVLERPPMADRPVPRPFEPPRRPRTRLTWSRAVVLGATVLAAGMAAVVAPGGRLGWTGARVVAVLVVAASPVVALRVHAARAAAATAAVVGLVALPAAGVIAVRSAGTFKGAAGAAAAIGALALLGGGAVGLLAPVSRWRRLGAVPAALLAASFVAWPVGNAVASVNLARPELGARTPADVGLRSEDARFTTPDGVGLSGWYIASSNRAAVVLLHGASSTRTAVLDHAAVLARHGYGVLLFDARGHGRSAGRPMEFGWHGDADIAGAVAYLQARPDVDPTRIGAVGMSMGGEEAVGALPAVPALKAVVGEGVTGRVAADKAWLSDRHGWRGTVTEWVSSLTYGLADLLTSASPPTGLRRAVTSSPAPVLLIAAGGVEDEGDTARWLQAASPTVQTWVVDGSGHIGGLRTEPVEWERRVAQFLDAALV